VPELPDVVLYVEHVERRIRDRPLARLRITSPFVLRSVDPPPATLEGLRAVCVHRVGKRIVLEFDEEVFAVMHLMIAGRLHWLDPGAHLHKKRTLCAFEFEAGTLQLTEAGTKKRASLHLVRGRENLEVHRRTGLDVFETDTPAFAAVLRAETHTLKRSLSDPHILDGIGNAYSDEILHAARLSPVTMSTKLDDAEMDRLHRACREVLREWMDRLRDQAGDGFPEKVTAFRPEMAVHGRYGEPCPRCGAPVQRIVYASRETNYCAPCQTGGRLLADRGLSRLLKKDWPRSLEDLEARRKTRAGEG
jgi:formamidopyrimidine-DNA glycosylase